MQSDTRCCHWAKGFNGETVLIPECMGCAVNGPDSCTCDVTESRLEAAERGRREAEQQVLRLEEARDRRLHQQELEWRHRKRLAQRVRELEELLRMAQQNRD